MATVEDVQKVRNYVAKLERHIRELEAERNGLSRHLEQALGTIERLVEERDRWKEHAAQRDQAYEEAAQEAEQWQESSGQNYVRAQDAEMREEALERERDRLRLAIERAPCGWADSEPVGTLYGAICDNCDCWKRAALNTEKDNG